MFRYPSSRNDAVKEKESLEQDFTWTETILVVEKASLFSENLKEGKTSLSTLLELAEEPESSSNPRNRTVIQLAFGLEEKDVPTFARLLGRKVFLSQQRPRISLEREDLEFKLSESLKLIASLKDKVKYLNDSLHYYVQESR